MIYFISNSIIIYCILIYFFKHNRMYKCFLILYLSIYWSTHFEIQRFIYNNKFKFEINDMIIMHLMNFTHAILKFNQTFVNSWRCADSQCKNDEARTLEKITHFSYVIFISYRNSEKKIDLYSFKLALIYKGWPVEKWTGDEAT